MAYQTTVIAANNLKTLFGNYVRSQHSERAPFYKDVEVAPTNFKGGDRIEAVTGQYVGSFQAVGHNPSHVPQPATHQVDRITLQKAYFLGSYSVDWFAIALSQGQDSAFMEEKAKMVDQLTRFIRQEQERMLWGDGTGILVHSCGTGSAASDQVPVGILSVTGVTSASWTFVVTKNQAVFLPPGRRFQAWDGNSIEPSDTGTIIAGDDEETGPRNLTKRDTPTDGFYTVSSNAYLTDTTNTITVVEASPGTNSPAANDLILACDSMIENATTSTTNAGTECMGYRGIADNQAARVQLSASSYQADTTFEGLNPAQKGYWNAHVVNGGGAAGTKFGRTLMRKIASSMSVSGTTEPDEISYYATHPDRIADYEAELEGAIRYNVNGNTPASTPGGTAHSLAETKQFLTFGGKDVRPGKYILPTDGYAINTAHVRRHEAVPLHFRNEHDDYGNRPATQGDLIGIWNVCTDERNSFGRLKNIRVA